MVHYSTFPTSILREGLKSSHEIVICHPATFLQLSATFPFPHILTISHCTNHFQCKFLPATPSLSSPPLCIGFLSRDEKIATQFLENHYFSNEIVTLCRSSTSSVLGVLRYKLHCHISMVVLYLGLIFCLKR
jgi:hypothetical protein